MEIKELHLVELQYQKTIQMILPYFYSDLNKNEQIRIRQWIKKLSSVINNILWRKNRNLYAKLLYSMLKTKSGLLEPFNKSPSENSLPKLSIYQIPFNLRTQIENQQRQNKCFNELKNKSKFEKSQTNKGKQQSKQNKCRKQNKQNSLNSMNLAKVHTKQTLDKTLKEIENRKLTDSYKNTQCMNKRNYYNQKKQNSQNQKQSKENPLNQRRNQIQSQSQIDFGKQLQQIDSLFTQSLQFLHDNYQQILIDEKTQRSSQKQFNNLKEIILKITAFQRNISHKQHFQSNQI